ncbi:uncharacterized protein LOC130447204 [Diorhabda sublineata]|uniref:uncharacterized protein LOC130447204 n=1 Tax=Diorhabda sublineata TaxID=1163346 RepID=UPI0024E122EA|nr:uncharacterized protein LOC130447204 [Diorhabda sublineata]
MDWDENEILKFIESYEQHCILWDPKHRSHYNKKLRNKAWDEIAAINNKSVDKCKRKLASLLATMRRERSKMRKNILAGRGYRSTWFAFEKFRFLWGKSKLHEPTKTEMQETQIENGSVEMTLDNEEMIMDNQEQEVCLEDVDEAPMDNPSDEENSFILSPAIIQKNIPNKKYSINKSTSKKSKENPTPKSFDSILQELNQKIEIPPLPEDEFDVFGKMVAVHLRQLPLNAALECQSEILHYIVQRRLGRNAMLSDINRHYSQFVPTPCISPVPSNASYSNFIEETPNNDAQPIANHHMTIKMENLR